MEVGVKRERKSNETFQNAKSLNNLLMLDAVIVRAQDRNIHFCYP